MLQVLRERRSRLWAAIGFVFSNSPHGIFGPGPLHRQLGLFLQAAGVRRSAGQRARLARVPPGIGFVFSIFSNGPRLSALERAVGFVFAERQAPLVRKA
jgi:hypothetical protein